MLHPAAQVSPAQTRLDRSASAGRRPPLPARAISGFLIAAGLLVGGCGPGDSPEVPVAADGTVDAELVEGRAVFSAQCARCHGGDGSGGVGTPLYQGAVLASFPEVSAQRAFIVEGKAGMPAFGERLDDDQLDAVVRYTREVLAVPEE